MLITTLVTRGCQIIRSGYDWSGRKSIIKSTKESISNRHRVLLEQLRHIEKMEIHKFRYKVSTSSCTFNSSRSKRFRISRRWAHMPTITEHKVMETVHPKRKYFLRIRKMFNWLAGKRRRKTSNGKTSKSIRNIFNYLII